MSKRTQWRKILGLKPTRKLYADKQAYGHRIKLVGKSKAAELAGFRARLEASGILVYNIENALSFGTAYGYRHAYDVVLIQVGQQKELHKCATCGAR